MNPLAKLQQQFARSLYAPADSAITASINGNGISTEARLSIYRNTVFSNLTQALRNAYPVITKLVGDAFFAYLATAYITATPATSGNLDAYGASFGDFLASFPEAASLPYLPDVAALEWGCHKAHHAADVLPIDAAALASVAPEEYGTLTFTCNPSCSLCHSRFPLLRIWEVHQPAYHGTIEVDLAAGASYCAVIRGNNFAITLLPISEATFHFLTHLAHGATLYTAYEAAESCDPDFDLAEAIRSAVTQEILVTFTIS